MRSPWLGALMVGVVAACVLGWDLASEPHFVDESAYYSQSYYAGIFFEGRRDDPAWLEFPAYDLPPLPKYLIGTALALGGFKTPNRADAGAWYADTSTRFEPPGALTLARVPFVGLGAVGCVAVYGLGVLLGGRAVGGLAAGFLLFNPLYHMHARRAMSDVPCEAFMLLGLFFALSVWRRSLGGRSIRAGLTGALLSGTSIGLAVLSKLSGTLALMVVAAWVALTWVVGRSIDGKLRFTGAMILAGAASATVFIALDPYLTAHPGGPLPPHINEVNRLDFGRRARKMAALRIETANGQKRLFKHNAMISTFDKVSTAAVQGFGRFGPFGPAEDDSTIRYDLAQDRGGFVWLPWVVAGAIWAGVLGLRQLRDGEPPTALAILLYFLVSLTVVTAYLPLAWNRYFLPIQAPSALLASGVAVAGLRMLGRGLSGRNAEA